MPKLFEFKSLRAGDPVVFSLSLAERDAICLRCSLADCVGIESAECSIRVEQRRIWREKNQERTARGYFAARESRLRDMSRSPHPKGK